MPGARLLLWLVIGCVLSCAAAAQATAEWIKSEAQPGDFILASAGGKAAPLLSDAADHRVVAIAARDLIADIARVSGQTPALLDSVPTHATNLVVLGTLGQSRWIDQLVAEGRLDLSNLQGQWESFIVTTIEAPWPNIPRALVIVGSDRRGTAYGAYELAQAIGVSPWHWWADVPPKAQPTLAVAPGTRRFGPPSVRYRGIFINDEDWALQPWAALTHEPENGDIGPRTYVRIFELLLRLKANTLWPAMHPSTRPFNAFRENPRLADDYAIVMGSSHAEPMLRNNVGEWKAPAIDYNYVTNRSGVLEYWGQRVRENAAFEAIYTLGMRGIHDSNMQGPRTDAERVATLHQVFRDQRDLLAQHVTPDVERIPQMFCAYKEVLDLYRQGLQVPDDVTIVWPDDNFGYIRNFAQASERGRSGGFGVYYHLSYLGRPLAFLWLHTTPPALVWQEMVKAYQHGADRIWIVNVGDLKPAEIGTEFFLQLAWDIDRWGPDAQPQFLRSWATREFGAAQADAIAEVMSEYFQLNFQRKPEHLQWWRQGEPYRHSPFTAEEADARLRAFAHLVARTAKIRAELPALLRDAFFQLVEYPVAGSAAANARYFHSEWYARTFDHHLPEARRHAAAARAADERLTKLTEAFGSAVANGKWRHFMTLEPADNQWRSMRIAALPVPAASLALGEPPADRIHDPAEAGPDASVVIRSAGDADAWHEATDARWIMVPGLGRSGRAVTVWPFTAVRRPPEALDRGPQLEYTIPLPSVGSHTLELQLLPTHPLAAGEPLRLAVSVNDQPFQIIAVPVQDGSAHWAQGVLENALRAQTEFQTDTPSVRLRLSMVDAGVVIDRILIHQGNAAPSYLGPRRL